MEHAAPEFVVHTDRARVNRRQGAFIGIFAAMVVVLTVLYGWFFFRYPDVPGTWFLVYVLLTVGPIVQILLHGWSLGRLTATSRVLVIGPRGIVVHSMDGYVRLPWQAIEAVSLKTVLTSQLLMIRMRPGAGQDPTVVAEVSARAWRRITKHGLMTNATFLLEPLPQVMSAIDHFSAGRVRLHP